MFPVIPMDYRGVGTARLLGKQANGCRRGGESAAHTFEPEVGMLVHSFVSATKFRGIEVTMSLEP